MNRKWSLLFLWIIFFFFGKIKAQKKDFWLIDIHTHKKTLAKDSLSAVRFLDSLAENKYYFLQLNKVEKDSTGIRIFYDKGQDFQRAKVFFSDSLLNDSMLKNGMLTPNLDSLKASIHAKYQAKGFVFNRIKTSFQGMENQIPKVKLSIVPAQKRHINGFIPKGYEKIPTRFMKNLAKQYVHQPYTEKILLAIQRDLQNHPLITLERPPQTLFSKDSTQIYLFLQKKKVNIFDAMVGFANDQTDKINFSGTVNLQFKNTFNSFENLGIYWQRTPEKSQTFNVLLHFPYLLGSNLGTDIQLNIFRQNEDFANVKFSPTLFYNINNWQKIGVKGGLEVSTRLNENNAQFRDYSKKGIGLTYHFTQPTAIELLQHTTHVLLEGQYFNNYYEKEDLTARQLSVFGKVERNFHIRGNHWLNAQIQGGWLKSNQEITFNELFRLGGWNSLRGFNENILAAESYYFGTIEYRYLIGNASFFDIFGQYGQIRNNTLHLRPQLYSFGVGFHFISPIGLMSFQISNGATTPQSPRFSDTKIHWGIITKF